MLGHAEELRERFERAKQGLQADAANIPMLGGDAGGMSPKAV